MFVLGPGELLIVIVVGVGVLLYLLPAFIAGVRHHQNQGAIFVLNLLLGWTILGWIASLVWVCTSVDPRILGGTSPLRTARELIPPPIPGLTETPRTVSAAAAAPLRFCADCGSPRPETGAFCPRCGTQFA